MSLILFFDYGLNCNIFFLFIDLSIYLNTFCVRTSLFNDELFVFACFIYLIYLLYFVSLYLFLDISLLSGEYFGELSIVIDEDSEANLIDMLMIFSCLSLFILDFNFAYSFFCLVIYKLGIVEFMGINMLFFIISFILLFFYFIYDAMHFDLILCYIFLECALLIFVLLNCLLFYIFWDIRFLVFSIFLISIAACEIAIGLSLLVRYK